MKHGLFHPWLLNSGITVRVPSIYSPTIALAIGQVVVDGLEQVGHRSLINFKRQGSTPELNIATS